MNKEPFNVFNTKNHVNKIQWFDFHLRVAMILFKRYLILCGVVLVKAELSCYTCNSGEKSCDNVTALYMVVNF